MIKVVVSFRFDVNEEAWDVDGSFHAPWDAAQYEAWEALLALNPALKGTPAAEVFDKVPRMSNLLSAYNAMDMRARLNTDIRGPFIINYEGDVPPDDEVLLAWWEVERRKKTQKHRCARN